MFMLSYDHHIILSAKRILQDMKSSVMCYKQTFGSHIRVLFSLAKALEQS